MIRDMNLIGKELTLPPDETADVLLNKTSIHLAYSKITGGVTALDPFSNLTELYMQQNYIDSIGDGFELTINLRLLFLQGNRIRHIDHESFFHLKRLELLDISNNLIEDCGRYGRNIFPPHSLSILDLKNNPVADSPKHRTSAVSSLPKLTILDGIEVTREDGENQATRMYVVVPILENDGTEAGEMMLNFDRDSDLWVVADSFCNVNEIDGEGARRELVTMMKREARRVWGTIVMDKEITLKKMVETIHLDDEIEDEEKGKRKEEEEEEEEDIKMDAIDEHEAAVRINTERAFHAVEDFLTEIEQQPSSKLAEKRTVLANASEARKERDVEVSQEAVDEAQRLLKEKVAKIQAEKEEMRRKREKIKMSASVIAPPAVPEETKFEESKKEAKEEAKGDEIFLPRPRSSRPLRKASYEDDVEEDNDELRFENQLLQSV